MIDVVVIVLAVLWIFSTNRRIDALRSKVLEMERAIDKMSRRRS